MPTRYSLSARWDLPVYSFINNVLAAAAHGDTHVVHDGCPAFHCNTLKHGQHSEENVIEANDAVFRSYPSCLAFRSARTDEPAAADAAASGGVAAAWSTWSDLFFVGVVPFVCSIDTCVE
jgi:hypothetical protein